MPTAENSFPLVISMLTLESFLSIRFARKPIISRLTNKSLHFFYYTLNYAAFAHLRWMVVITKLVLSCAPPFLKDSAIFLFINDTIAEKYDTKFQGGSKLFDYTTHDGSNYLNGHCFISIISHMPFRPVL